MPFPHDITLSEVTEVINRHNESLGSQVFIRAERGPFVIFNYNYQFAEAFPPFTGDPVRDREIAIIRECRGLTFYADTGEIAALKLTKFFNIGQNEETQIHNLDFNRPHVIMEKLDGSMLVPVRNDDMIEWHTKMGATDVAKPVEEFVADRPEYEVLARMCIEKGMTPIFEWTSRQQRIVIDYPEDQLVLLHVRNNRTGEYMSRHELEALALSLGIPAVKVFEDSITDIHAFVEYTRALKNAEGFVVQFSDGSMIKLKADEYCAMHNSKEKINLEKNVIAMIFSETFDDTLALLDYADNKAIQEFQNAVMAEIGKVAQNIQIIADEIKARPECQERREYARYVNELELPGPHYKSLMFKAYEGRDLVANIINAIKNGTGSATRLEEVRPLFGNIYWAQYRGFFDGDA
jgi:RNA ligase